MLLLARIGLDNALTGDKNSLGSIERDQLEEKKLREGLLEKGVPALEKEAKERGVSVEAQWRAGVHPQSPKEALVELLVAHEVEPPNAEARTKAAQTTV